MNDEEKDTVMKMISFIEENWNSFLESVGEEEEGIVEVRFEKLSDKLFNKFNIGL